MQYFAGVKGRDEVRADIEIKDGVITNSKIMAIGCLPFLKLVDEFRAKITGDVKQISLPKTSDHAALIIKELLLKLMGEWNFPYKDLELCHCRAISCERVDASIVYGARTAEDVAKNSSAGTGCGTCRKDTENIIKFRLG